MKSKRRRWYAGIAAGAGFSLILFELRTLRRASAVEFWFWLIVGILLTVIGSIEFMADREEGK